MTGTVSNWKTIRTGRPRPGSKKTWQATLYWAPSMGKAGSYVCFYVDPSTQKRTSRSRVRDADAQAMFDEVEAMLDLADAGRPVPGRETIAEVSDRYIQRLQDRYEAEDLRLGTLDNAERICRLHIVPVIGHIEVRLWTSAHSKEVIKTAGENGLKDLAAIRKTMAGLVAEAEEEPRLLPIGSDPLRNLRVPRNRGGVQGAAQRFVSLDQRPATVNVRRLVVAAWFIGKTRGTPWLHLMFRIAGFCGLRFSELVGLRACDYDPGDRNLTVRYSIEERRGKQTRAETKNTLLRTVPVTKSIDRYLSTRVKQVHNQPEGDGPWPLGGPEGLLFPGPNGKPWTRKYWRLLVYLPACVRVGWTRPVSNDTDGNPNTLTAVGPKMPFHSLRHHCATWWHTQPPNGPGRPWEDISVRLGHSSVSFTLDTYVNPSEESDDEFRDALDNF